MSLTEKERTFLKETVKRMLADVKEENKSIIETLSPIFPVAEHEYEIFLKNLLEKL